MNSQLYSMKRSKRRLVALIALLSILIAGAVTVVSRQSDRIAKSRDRQPEAATNSTLAIKASLESISSPSA